MPKCIKCATTESQRWYFGNTCRSCRRKELRDTPVILKTREIKALNKKDPKCWDCEAEASRKWYKDHTQCDACFKREYRANNQKKISEYNQKYRKLNKAQINQTKRQYRQRTGKHKFLESRRRAAKLQALPIWACLKDIELIYKNCPQNMTVDHIIPLQNSNVCGLHVPWNLHYLSLSENSYKHNKFDFTYENTNWRKDTCQGR